MNYSNVFCLQYDLWEGLLNLTNKIDLPSKFRYNRKKRKNCSWLLLRSKNLYIVSLFEVIPFAFCLLRVSPSPNTWILQHNYGSNLISIYSQTYYRVLFLCIYCFSPKGVPYSNIIAVFYYTFKIIGCKHMCKGTTIDLHKNCFVLMSHEPIHCN